MSKRWFTDQFDERMRDEAKEIDEALQRLILVISRAETEVTNAMKELKEFIDRLDKK